VVLLGLTAAPLARADEADDVLEYLADKLSGGSSSISSALSQYSRIERSERYDVFKRYKIHRGLLRALRKESNDALATAAARILRRPSTSNFPAQVLLMKALIGSSFPAPRRERIAYLADMAKDDDYRLSIWGLRLLGDSRWPESVDALIEIMRREEEAGRVPEGLLWNFTAMELFRLLGAKAAQGGSGAIKKNWEEMGRKLPDDPSYEMGAGGEGGGVTMVFFGDRISPRSVFAIDTSTSMRRNATLRRPAPGDSGGSQPKVEIVKGELERAVSGLQPFCKFNILSYNSTYYPWTGGLQLITATSSRVKSAVSHARGLEVSPGTNIHDTLAAGLTVPDVETIYLLSDGAPSRGGGPPEIRRRVEAMNYLKGIRVVTYGFAGKGGADEGLMKWLAKNNWGWYRRLNK
jgi:hypothetical protein